MIEMLQNGSFPQVFNPTEEENIMIDKRVSLYSSTLQKVFDDYSLLKIDVMKEHLI